MARIDLNKRLVPLPILEWRESGEDTVHYRTSSTVGDLEGVPGECLRRIVEVAETAPTIASLVAELEEEFDQDDLLELLESLHGSLWTTISPADRAAAPPELASALERKVAILGAGELAKTTERVLMGSGFKAVHRDDGSAADLRRLADQHDVVVCLLEGVAFSAVLEVNAACLAADTPALFATIESQEFLLGPVVIPWQSPCFECSRRTMFSRGWEAITGELFAERRLGTVDACLREQLPLVARKVERDLVRLLGHGTGPGLLAKMHVLDRQGDQRSLKARISSWCRQCHGANRDGIRRARPGAEEVPQFQPLKSRPIVDRIAASRTVATKDAIEIAKVAIERLNIELNVEGIPEAVLENYPELQDVSFYRARGNTIFDLANPRFFYDDEDNFYGKGPTPEQAWCSAVYEWFERNLPHYRGHKGMIRASYDEVKDLAIDLPRHHVGLPALWRSAHQPFDPKTPLDWVWGHSLNDERAILLPAVDLLWFGNLAGSEITRPARGSSGLSAGCATEDAFFQGFLEVIEHDAWYSAERTGADLPDIDPSSVDEPISAGLIETLRSAGFSIRIRDMTNDLGVPVVQVILRSTRDLENIHCPGHGCHPDARIALRRALTEAFQVICSLASSEHDSVLTAPLGMFSRRTFAERIQAPPATRTRSFSELLVDDVPSDILEQIRRVVNKVTTAVPESEVCYFEYDVPVDGVHLVNAFVTCLNDQLTNMTHLRERLFNYRQIIEGADAPKVTMDAMYLGRMDH